MGHEMNFVFLFISRIWMPLIIFFSMFPFILFSFNQNNSSDLRTIWENVIFTISSIILIFGFILIWLTKNETQYGNKLKPYDKVILLLLISTIIAIFTIISLSPNNLNILLIFFIIYYIITLISWYYYHYIKIAITNAENLDILIIGIKYTTGILNKINLIMEFFFSGYTNDFFIYFLNQFHVKNFKQTSKDLMKLLIKILEIYNSILFGFIGLIWILLKFGIIRFRYHI
jgi:hypothetical protein